MRTPKEAFLHSGHAQRFREGIALTETFELACEYALLQLLSEMSPNTLSGRPVDPYAGMDANAQMHGAARVLAILSAIGNPKEEPKNIKRPTIHYDQPHASSTRSPTSSTDSTPTK